MSSLINVADDVYANLTRLKKAKKTSYSRVIREILACDNEKKYSMEDILEDIGKLEKNTGKKKREHIDHDLVAYGVSRADS